jgi:RNA polymerase subunit RPABC4/transcription elongation factor Spt4
MDDLDRLYYEFVETLRREWPSRLTDRFTVLELHDEIIPYRRVRNPVGFRSNDDYEAVLSRLLAGERGYLLGDGAMQEEVRAGLEETLPDIRRYRAFPNVHVWLDPEEIPPPGDIRYAPPEMREQTEMKPPAEVRESEAEPGRGSEFASSTSEKMAESELAAEDVRRPELREVSTGERTTRSPGLTTELELCPHCGSGLPDGAEFCPFCGVRISAERCANCGAAIEPAWRFCAACGVPRADDHHESA